MRVTALKASVLGVMLACGAPAAKGLLCVVLLSRSVFYPHAQALRVKHCPAQIIVHFVIVHSKLG